MIFPYTYLMTPLIWLSWQTLLIQYRTFSKIRALALGNSSPLGPREVPSNRQIKLF